MKSAFIPLTAASLSVLSACSETVAPDVQQPVVEPPVVAYSQTALETPFFTAGQTDAPSVAWNGEQGTLTIGSPVTGVTIDPNNGTVSWDPSLPLGENAINVVAANSAGQNSVNIVVRNQFQGEFSGELGPEPTGINAGLTLDYASDGMVAVTTGIEGVFAAGTWELDGSVLTTAFQYTGIVSFASLEAATRTFATEVVHSVTSAELEGPWYHGVEVIQGSESGVAEFHLVLP